MEGILVIGHYIHNNKTNSISPMKAHFQISSFPSISLSFLSSLQASRARLSNSVGEFIGRIPSKTRFPALFLSFLVGSSSLYQGEFQSLIPIMKSSPNPYFSLGFGCSRVGALDPENLGFWSDWAWIGENSVSRRPRQVQYMNCIASMFIFYDSHIE